MSYEKAMSIIEAPVTTNFEEETEVDVRGLNPGYESDEECEITPFDAAVKIMEIINRNKTTKRRGRPRKRG